MHGDTQRRESVRQREMYVGPHAEKNLDYSGLEAIHTNYLGRSRKIKMGIRIVSTRSSGGIDMIRELKKWHWYLLAPC